MSTKSFALPKSVPVLAGIPLCLASAGVIAQAVPGGTLDPTTIPKYVTPLVIPPVLYDDGGSPMSVDVAQRQFSQQVLPTTGCTAASAAQQAAGGPAIACVGDAFPQTTLWGYGDPAQPATFNNPSFTFEVTKDIQTTVTWRNQLIDGGGNFLPHIIQDAGGIPIVDQTLHWAAPNQDCANGLPAPNGDTDCRGASGDPYLGPIPMVVHVHGAHVGPGSDGYPEAWWLPSGAEGGIDCTNVDGYPATPDTADDFDCNGTFFESDEGNDTANALGQGYAIDVYPNDQPTTTLWYHDHTLGMTRLNVYAGGAGFWLIRDANDGETGLVSGVLPGPAPQVNEDPNGDPTVRAKIREIPIAIQPKSFYADGDQFYPADRAFFEGLGTGSSFAQNANMTDGAGGPFPFLPGVTSDIAPVWNPEAFFNTMVVNGSTWPELKAAPERYRLRLLNASDSRFLNLSMYTLKPNGKRDTELPFYQIGAEQSLLPQVVQIETGFATPLAPNAPLPKNPSQKVKGTFKEQALLLGPAERADVIVDFTGLPQDTIVRVFNTAPDAPFGGFPDVPADPLTTGQVMQFRIDTTLANPTGDPSTPPNALVLESTQTLPDGTVVAAAGGVAKLGAPNALRDLALLEEESAELCVTVDAKTGFIDLVPGSVPPACALGGLPFAPKAAVLGVNGSAGGQVQLWDEPIAQNPQIDAIETWELWNWSADAHPIHLHLVKFEVVNREIIAGAVRPPEPWEAGWKDTVIAYPGEVTRVKAKFDIPGLYVWHCHILSHEDNEMMVPYCVGDLQNDCTLPGA